MIKEERAEKTEGKPLIILVTSITTMHNTLKYVQAIYVFVSDANIKCEITADKHVQ